MDPSVPRTTDKPDFPSGGVENGPYHLADERLTGRMGNYPSPLVQCPNCASRMDVIEVAPVGGTSSLLWVMACCDVVQTWAATDYPQDAL